MLTMLLSAVDAVTGGFEYEDVFRCLKTGMAGVSTAECDICLFYTCDAAGERTSFNLWGAPDHKKKNN